MNPRRTSKDIREHRHSEKTYLPAQLGAAIAMIAAVIALLLYAYPQPHITLPGLQILSALGIRPVFTTHDQGVYLLIAAVAFLAATIIKFFAKNPIFVLPRYLRMRNIWWSVLMIDLIFDVFYVVTVYFSRWEIFFAAMFGMVAIDAVVLNKDEHNVPYIVAADLIEAIAYAGLTLLFVNLVVLQH